MRHRDGTFKGVRESDIYYQCWLPDGESKAGLVVVHGLAEHSGRYANLVERFVPLGYALYALDHVGHGRSDGTRVYVDRFDDYIETLKTFVDMARDWQLKGPLFLVGHSMGGLISVAYLIEHQDDFRGAVLSAPAVKVAEGISSTQITVSKVLSNVAPKMGVVQLEAGAICKDPTVVQAYIDDPLVHSGKITARLGAETIRTMQEVGVKTSAITLPILIVQGGDDSLIESEGAQMLYDIVGSEDKRLITYPGLYHEVFNEPEREQVLDDVEAWLAIHVGES